MAAAGLQDLLQHLQGLAGDLCVPSEEVGFGLSIRSEMKFRTWGLRLLQLTYMFRLSGPAHTFLCEQSNDHGGPESEVGKLVALSLSLEWYARALLCPCTCLHCRRGQFPLGDSSSRVKASTSCKNVPATPRGQLLEHERDLTDSTPKSLNPGSLSSVLRPPSEGSPGILTSYTTVLWLPVRTSTLSLCSQPRAASQTKPALILLLEAAKRSKRL